MQNKIKSPDLKQSHILTDTVNVILFSILISLRLCLSFFKHVYMLGGWREGEKIKLEDRAPINLYTCWVLLSAKLDTCILMLKAIFPGDGDVV